MKSNRKTRRPRLRGRPGPASNEDFRERILNAAERLFATQGFAATSIRNIAEDVGVNPAMVHYYFGSKIQLLRAVMDHVVEPLAGSMSAWQQDGKTNLHDLIHLMFSAAANHPYLPQLITREVLLPGGTMQQQFLEHFAPRLGGRLPGILLKAQRSGLLAPGVDVNIVALIILSVCMFPFVAKPAAEQVLHVAYDDAGLRHLEQHISGFVQRGFNV